MKAILEWLPLVWTVRIGLLVVLAGAVYVYVLLVAPFFRWRNIRNLVRADLPRVASVGGEFGGARAEVKLAQTAQEEQVESVENRLAVLEARVRVLLDRGGVDDVKEERS